MLIMFFSFARNSSSTPLSCGFTLGFIRSPKNKIARFQRCPRQNLAISSLENQINSLSTIHCFAFLTGDYVIGFFRHSPRRGPKPESVFLFPPSLSSGPSIAKNRRKLPVGLGRQESNRSFLY